METISRIFAPNVDTEDGEDFNVRIVMIDNKPWFCNVDVCKALCISNTRQAIQSLNENKKRKIEILIGVSETDTPPQKQFFNFISESGLYKLIMKSTKKEAEVFQDWICEEVIPSIRKTGMYLTNEKKNDLTIENLSRLMSSQGVLFLMERDLTLSNLLKDTLTNMLQNTSSDNIIKIKDISQHMVDMKINPSIIQKYRSEVGKYVKSKYMEKYKDEPPKSDKYITYNSKRVDVTDFHNGGNRPVFWYPPHLYDEVKEWIKEYFTIKKPELEITPSNVFLLDA